MSCQVPLTLNGKQACPRCDTPDLLLTSALERDESASAGLSWLTAGGGEPDLLQVSCGESQTRWAAPVSCLWSSCCTRALLAVAAACWVGRKVLLLESVAESGEAVEDGYMWGYRE